MRQALWVFRAGSRSWKLTTRDASAITLSEICQSIYAIKATANRITELTRLDSQLSKWLIELPEHLRFDPAAPKTPPPPPHILTLHMKYWCTVLLLRRPLCVISAHRSPSRTD